MMCGSPWNPPDEVQDNVRQYVDEVAQVLKSSGRWLYITYNQPHFVKRQLTCESSWDSEVRRLDDGQGTFECYASVMTKYEVHDHIEDVKIRWHDNGIPEKRPECQMTWCVRRSLRSDSPKQGQQSVCSNTLIEPTQSLTLKSPAPGRAYGHLPRYAKQRSTPNFLVSQLFRHRWKNR